MRLARNNIQSEGCVSAGLLVRNLFAVLENASGLNAWRQTHSEGLSARLPLHPTGNPILTQDIADIPVLQDAGVLDAEPGCGMQAGGTQGSMMIVPSISALTPIRISPMIVALYSAGYSAYFEGFAQYIHTTIIHSKEVCSK